MNGRVGSWLLTICVVAPWINPVTFGPTPGLYPIVFSWLCIASFVCIAQTTAPEPADISNGWMIAGAISGGIGLVQFFGHSAEFGSFVSQVRAGEAFANLRQRNQFASLCNIALAAAILGWSSQGSRTDKGVRATVIVLAIAGGIASASRTGLLQTVMLGTLLFVWSRGDFGSKAKRILPLVGVYLLGLFLLVFAHGEIGANFESIGILSRLTDTSDPCHSRLTLWSNVLHLISLRPLTGWGWGELGYAHYSTLYDGPRFCEILDNAHNLPLHLAVELGLPVAIAVCAVIGWLIWRMNPWAERDPSRQLAWAVLMVIGIHSMLEYPLWYGPFQMAVLLCVYMLWPEPSPGDDESVAAVYAKPASYLISFCVIAGCLYAAWDYRRVSQLYLPGDARVAAYRENTLEKVSGSRLFRNQVEFAELMTTPLNPATAPRIYILSRRMLHFSAEPSVIEKAIESSRALGFFDEADFHMDRYRAAFPDAYQRWLHRA